MLPNKLKKMFKLYYKLNEKIVSNKLKKIIKKYLNYVIN